MPIIYLDGGIPPQNTPTTTTDLAFLGITSPAPLAPIATATAPSGAFPISQLSPDISSTPSGGQGIATTTSGSLPVTAPATAIKAFTSDPDNVIVGQIWYRSDTSQLCIRHDFSTTKRVTLA
jgi:hypothetical protein